MKTSKIIALLVLTVLMGTIASCKPKNPKTGVEPTANFAFKMASDLTVTFTNNSEDAEEYAWSFGDGKTSTEASPVHKYTEKKIYSVTLTVTNGDYSDSMTREVDTSKAPWIDIDGKFADWNSSNIKATYTLPADVETLYGITACKVVDDDNYIYFYVETIREVSQNLSIYYRFSTNPVGTYNAWMFGGYPQEGLSQWTQLTSADWVREERQDINIIGYTEHLGTTWPSADKRRDIIAVGSGLYECSGVVEIDKTATFADGTYPLYAMEISMRKSLIASLLGTTFKVGFYLQNGSWADAGACPGPAHATENAPFTYDFATKNFVSQ